MISSLRLVPVAFVLFLATGCGGGHEAFSPGLGEIMSLQQGRHAKLWFAGQAGNWELAAYEVDELEEGFADALHFHPTHKSSPQPLAKAIPTYMAAPIAALREAVAGKDSTQFSVAHDALTAGCNGCHRATEFAFNVVVRPKLNPFANQDFTVPAK